MSSAGSRAERRRRLELVDLLKDAERHLTICNACRYCEGLLRRCFPAMELRAEFAKKDTLHLANLCHDCGSCYYACQYAPPHEFAVNLPEVLWRSSASLPTSSIRCRTGWRLLHGAAAVAAVVLAAVVRLLVIVAVPAGQPVRDVQRPGARSTKWCLRLAMFVPGMLVAIYGIVVPSCRATGSRRDTDGPVDREVVHVAIARGATADVLALRYLRGGRPGLHVSHGAPVAPARRVPSVRVLRLRTDIPVDGAGSPVPGRLRDPAAVSDPERARDPRGRRCRHARRCDRPLVPQAARATAHSWTTRHCWTGCSLPSLDVVSITSMVLLVLRETPRI